MRTVLCILGLVGSAAIVLAACAGLATPKPAATTGDSRDALPSEERSDGVQDARDGVVDDGGVDCGKQACVRFEISEERMRRGAGRAGVGECVGPVYCGRIDGFATTSPPGGCGEHHCATVIWPDRTAEPHHCTIYGRCVGGAFVPEGFSW